MHLSFVWRAQWYNRHWWQWNRNYSHPLFQNPKRRSGKLYAIGSHICESGIKKRVPNKKTSKIWGECKSGGDSIAICVAVAIAVGLLAAIRNSIHFPSQRSSRLYTTRHPHFRVKINIISEHKYRIGKTVHLQQLQYGGECRSGGDGSAAYAAAAVSRKQKLYSSFFLCI